MLKKLRLEQTKKYELAIAANLVSTMLTSFVSGRSHSLSIGSEQGGVEKWDDLVIELSTDHYQHIQIKRQNSSFCTPGFKPVRDNYTSGPRQGMLRDLSPLDESMHKLGAYLLDPAVATQRLKRSFSILIPDLRIDIKEGLSLKELYELCQTQIKVTTTSAGLQALEQASPTAKKIFDWLRTWCGFVDHAHILNALRVFEVRQCFGENEIDADTKRELSTCFSKPTDVLRVLVSFIDENSSFTSAVTPRPLLFDLLSYLLPSTVSWTQFRKDEGGWNVSGIHDRRFGFIEHPSSIVPTLWGPPGAGILKYYSKDHSSGPLPKAIIRLLLHIQPAAVAHVSDKSAWSIVAKNLVGETLGISEDDCEALHVQDDSDCYVSSDKRVLEKLRDSEAEAELLSIEMHKKSWELIGNHILRKLEKLPSSELRDAVEDRWQLWKDELDKDIDKQKLLCQSMLHPKAEGEDISAELRFGPKTTSMVADGILLLMVVVICIGDKDSNWDTIDTQLTISVKALSHWSGPFGQTRRVRKITEDGVSALIGKEPSKILVLSRIDASSSTVLQESLIDDTDFAGSMASPRQPILLVTNNPTVNRLIRQGIIADIKEYLNGKLKKSLAARNLTENE
ncbi:hypothetical protein GCM10011375_39120 [Hymenobacter qilianensis]|uniref:ABC-three component systems C-terminal domain-containing protein n=2 Tax=Hymenobacter qilianensis TaxID=1385715 RepID=A0A7H0H1H6_9BACT|nr:ABC-three component system protein [Hymenobacter qilianensis]QNP54392.1 hypothetical protein H9L05_22225 [Hymenobacter qilianensis]GGF80226.1 hypothetical protein GCM10011375_39120 [Hymenobacter qilianensis]